MMRSVDSIIEDLTESCFQLPSIFQGDTAGASQLALNQVSGDAYVQIIFTCPRIERFAHLGEFIGNDFFPLFYVH